MLKYLVICQLSDYIVGTLTETGTKFRLVDQFIYNCLMTFPAEPAANSQIVLTAVKVTIFIQKKEVYMLGALTLILLCQLVGEIISKACKLPVPGPVIGMIIMFCVLAFYARSLPHEIETVGGFLLRYLALLFVPAGVGIITNAELLWRSLLPIAGVIVVGTMLTIGVTGLTMQSVHRRLQKRSAGGRQ